MESKKETTLICFDALNWLEYIFRNVADAQFSNPWDALRYSDHAVGEFISAARASNYELLAVASGGANGTHARETNQLRQKQEIVRELQQKQEIVREKREFCLGANLFLIESFENHGVGVVRPIDADVKDVLAALAVRSANNFKRAIVLSKTRSFSGYDKAILVSRGFIVRGDKLILEPSVTRDDFRCPTRNSLIVQPHLALVAMSDEWRWSHSTAYRPSLRNEGRIARGTTSSTDKKMGNLHILARPLRAAVYAILGERKVQERIPEWIKDEEMVVWIETEVVADPTLISVLEDPLATVKWLVERDAPALELEPWRVAERMFNICALAAELVSVASQGAWTMFKCMELFSRDAEIMKQTTHHCTPPSPATSQAWRKREAQTEGAISRFRAMMQPPQVRNWRHEPRFLNLVQRHGRSRDII